MSAWRWAVLRNQPCFEVILKFTEEQELFLVYHLHFTTIRNNLSHLAIIFGQYFGPRAPVLVPDELEMLYGAYLEHRLIEKCFSGIRAPWVNVAHFASLWETMGLRRLPYEYCIRSEQPYVPTFSTLRSRDRPVLTTPLPRPRALSSSLVNSSSGSPESTPITARGESPRIQ
jgi:hypothetical protein